MILYANCNHFLVQYMCIYTGGIMDFYEISMKHLDELTKSEMKIYQYILDNITTIHSKTVRAIARECYVSTSTILRLVKKLGFEGYNEMTLIIKFTLSNKQQSSTVISEKKHKYKDEYSKNISETIRVIDEENIAEVCSKINNSKRLFIFSRGSIKAHASYFEFLFKLKGIDVYYPDSSVARNLYVNDVHEYDVAVFVDYNGNDEHLLGLLSKVKANSCNNIVSITQANNNLMQNMSNFNFYYFSDEVLINGFDATSNISVYAILEIIFHNL